MTIAKIPNTPYGLQTWDGDSGNLTFTGLPTDHDDYEFFMEVHGATDIVKTAQLNGESEVDVEFTVADTTALGVGRFPYGVKVCRNGIENTLIPNLSVSNQAHFIVNKKVVEGTDE